MKTNITAVYFVDWLEDCPARVNRVTGEMFLNRQLWPTFSPAHRKFILFHEAGHATKQTKSEIEADKFALACMIEHGESLTESLKALTRILDESRPGHRIRMKALFETIRNYDYYFNENEKVSNYMKPKKLQRIANRNPKRAERIANRPAKKQARRSTMMKLLPPAPGMRKSINMGKIQFPGLAQPAQNNLLQIMPQESYQVEQPQYMEPMPEFNQQPYNDPFIFENNDTTADEDPGLSYEEFVEMYGDAAFSDMKGKQFRQAKRAAKIDKKNARTDVVKSRALKNAAKAEGIKNGTFDPSAGTKSILGAAGDIIGGIFGKNKSAAADQNISDGGSGATTDQPTDQEAKKKKNTMIIVIVVVVVIIILGVAFRKKIFGKK